MESDNYGNKISDDGTKVPKRIIKKHNGANRIKFEPLSYNIKCLFKDPSNII